MINELLARTIESLLFVSSRPLSVKELAKIFDADAADIEKTLIELQAARRESGIVLLHANNNWQLATHPDSTLLVQNFLQSDLKEKLSDASLEVLSIVAYRQPVSRAEIEAIRGVNSQYSVRLLLMRGLIEKVGGSRSTRYQITTEFLQHMGIGSVTQLPHYQETVAKIQLPNAPDVPSSADTRVGGDAE